MNCLCTTRLSFTSGLLFVRFSRTVHWRSQITMACFKNEEGIASFHPDQLFRLFSVLNERSQVTGIVTKTDRRTYIREQYIFFRTHFLNLCWIQTIPWWLGRSSRSFPGIFWSDSVSLRTNASFPKGKGKCSQICPGLKKRWWAKRTTIKSISKSARRTFMWVYFPWFLRNFEKIWTFDYSWTYV